MLDAEEREVSSRGRLDLLLEQWGVDDAPFGAEERRLAQMTQHRLGIMASW